MTEFQAALGATQLTKLERVLRIRREIAARYEHLLGATGITCPAVGPEHILQSYVVLLPPGLSVTATDVVKKVRDAGVEVTVGTWHMPLAAYYRERYGYRRGDFPATDDVFARAVSLPLHHLLTSEDQAIVTKTLLDAARVP
jgi:dTDP-4-amino-4,6-dideoxygalactose transaminase